MLILLPLNTHAARTSDQNLGWPGNTLASNECYGGGQGFGPFDYTDPETARPGKYGQSPPLHLVEIAHFTPEVEHLVRGKSGAIYGDLDYTLRAFPNHHRALWSMVRYYLGQIKAVGYETLKKNELTHDGAPPPECYFNRAIVFAPEDPMVPAIFGIYLHRRGMLDAALASYMKAEKQLRKHAELAYNMGLLYVDLGNLEKAREYAERAQTLGYPLSGLQRKIAQWSSEIQLEGRKKDKPE